MKTPKTFPLKKYIIKEIDGCGGAHQLIDKNYIIQEFVDGEAYSVSFIVQNNDNENNKKNENNKIYPLCLNKQYIKDHYCGGEVNISHPLKEDIINESKRALKQIEGLNGYVGVDVIVNENDIYVLEINPRITTSIAGLETNPSLTKLLVDNSLKKDLKYDVKEGKRFIREKEGFVFY